MAISLIVLIVSVAIPSTAGQEGVDAVTVDEQMLRSSIPIHMILGQTYEAKVMLTNHLNSPATVEVRIDAPLQYMYAEPFMIQAPVGASESQQVKFAITPHEEEIGPLSVKMIITVTAQEKTIERKTLTTEVRQISRPVAYQLMWVIIPIVVVFSLMVYLVYRARHRRQRVEAVPKIDNLAR